MGLYLTLIECILYVKTFFFLRETVRKPVECLFYSFIIVVIIIFKPQSILLSSSCLYSVLQDKRNECQLHRIGNDQPASLFSVLSVVPLSFVPLFRTYVVQDKLNLGSFPALLSRVLGIHPTFLIIFHLPEILSTFIFTFLLIFCITKSSFLTLNSSQLVQCPFSITVVSGKNNLFQLVP